MGGIELKFLPTIEWYLTKWLHDNGFEGVTARANTDFEYAFNSRSIGFAFAVDERSEEIYEKFIEKHFPDFPYVCDRFLTSFFHELGHEETEDEFDDYEAILAEKDKIFEIEDDYERHMTYFEMPFEFRASEWGLNYIMANPDKIAEFARMVNKLLQWFFKVNDVELD